MKTVLARSGALAIACALAATMQSIAPAADKKEACLSSYESAQRLKKAGKLRATRAELAICMDAACPEFVRTECTKWMEDVERDTPTITISAKDQAGNATDAVRVSIDGQLVVERLDGRAIAVDPGPHDVRYEHGSKVIAVHILATDGQKNQPLVADFSTPPPKVEAPPAGRAIPVATYVLGGVAVVGLASFAAFGLAGRGVQSCSPTCSQDQISSLRRDYVIADVSLLVALAATGGALYFALSSKPAAPPQTTGWWLTIAPQLAGATVGAAARF